MRKQQTTQSQSVGPATAGQISTSATEIQASEVANDAPSPSIETTISRAVADDPEAMNRLGYGKMANSAWHGAKPTVHVWEIPGADGYTLRIEIEGAADVEVACGLALEHQISTGRTRIANEDVPVTRPLSEMESQWVKSVAPKIVRDTKDVTMPHAEALAQNERLLAQNVAFASTKKLFEAHIIDVTNPQAFIDRINAEAAAVVRERDEQRDIEKKHLAAGLKRMASEFNALIESSGHADPKPFVAPEPDYSPLTVYCDSLADAQKYERLHGANWIERPLDAPLTDLEREGARLILGTDKIVEGFMVRTPLGETERAGLEAILPKLRAFVGEV